MKKLILILLVVFIVFVAYNRRRLYLRDPLGSVTHNGVKEDGAQVFVNYVNDVLLENDNPPMRITLIQHDNHIGTPQQLKCLHFLVCLADSDVATLIAPDTSAVVESMSGKSVIYRQGKQQTVVTLR